MGVQAPASARPSASWRPLYSVLGDERLARMVGDGSKQAFAPLYERYYQQLYRYCRSIVHDDLDAQDALQSTFASALIGLRKGHRDAPLRPWLFSIAHDALDAQDALQSTFASAFVALRKGQRDAPLRPWLFRIAHNEAVSVI